MANEESLDLRWVAETEVELLDLHPGFARTWPLLRELQRGPERGAARGAAQTAERAACSAARAASLLLRGMPLSPRGPGRTASTWLTPSRLGSKASADPAM